MTTPILLDPYLKKIFKQFVKNRLGFTAFLFLLLFVAIGLYAPLFASSKPLLVVYEGKWYFPLFRYLFYPGFYTKPIDLFYNILMLTVPLGIIGCFLLKKGYTTFLIGVVGLQIAVFLCVLLGIVKDPAALPSLTLERQQAVEKRVSFREDPLLAPISAYPSWSFELEYMTPYEKLNRLLRYQQRQKQHNRLLPYAKAYEEKNKREMPTLWEVDQRNLLDEKKRLLAYLETHAKEYEYTLNSLPELMKAYRPHSYAFLMAKMDLQRAQKRLESLSFVSREKEDALAHVQKAQMHYEAMLQQANATRLPLEQARSFVQSYQQTAGRLTFLEEKERWEHQESQQLHVLMPPLLRPFHWEDDAGGGQNINSAVPWWELSRVNRKDLVAGLLFGIRISLVVGFTAVFLSLLIGIPLGMVSAYFAGKVDMLTCRLIEIWEAMPTFFMLLLIIAITQSKSIFLVISVLGIFGWTGLARFMRGEVLKQRGLPYVMACHSQGFRHPRIMFSHILPNAIPPILTLLPFSMMAAITSEAGISFLGLGEEGSTSWGVLMAEGRSVFPGESYLLWPPAILLTILLICIALVGDALRDAIDPKMQK